MRANEFEQKVLIGPDNFDISNQYFFNGVGDYDSWDDFKYKKNKIIDTLNDFVKFGETWKKVAKPESISTKSLEISQKLATIISHALSDPSGYKILKKTFNEEVARENLRKVSYKIFWYQQYFNYQEKILTKLSEKMSNDTHKKLIELLAKSFGQLAHQTDFAKREVVKHIELKYGKNN